MSSHAKCLLIILLITGCVKALAQTTASSGTNSSNPLSDHENDPYSKYGIGQLINGNNTVLKEIGRASCRERVSSPV